MFVIKLDLKRKGGDATSEISTPIFCWFPTFSSFDEFDSYRIKKKHFIGFDSNWTDKRELGHLEKRFIWGHLILPLAWVFHRLLYEASWSHLDQGEVINYTSKGILIMIRNKKVSECLSKDPLWIDSFVWNSCGYWISKKDHKIPLWNCNQKLLQFQGSIVHWCKGKISIIAFFQ